MLQRLEVPSAAPAATPAWLAAIAQFPNRFPVEAKGSSKDASSTFWSASWQLVEYWSSVAIAYGTAPEIGYGIVVSTSHIRDEWAAQRTLNLHLFLPKNHTALTQQLNPPPADREGQQAFMEAFEDVFVTELL
jgi:hypothetical protein